MQLTGLEILAPSKNRDIGIAAIDCGADALYIAGPNYGAREAAGNPMKEIEQLVKYAHRYDAKVYLTLNTILFDDEIDKAVKIAWQAYEAGCDALIIQDLGLLERELPPLYLFASTQADIRTPHQAKLLENLGFSRLILARELSVSDIAKIRESCSVQLESFVHGALCVSYSGQCYISSNVTGRSGNRGECAQVCRSSFNLTDSKGDILIQNRPLLSLKDLNLSSYIPMLAEAGVTSFKIEGRLKGESYIKNIVRYYRNIVDAYLERDLRFVKTSYGKVYGGFTPRPQSTFNRGYTNLFIEGKRESWSSGASAKSVGEYIGVVDKVGSDSRGNLVFSYSSSARIGNGDGICFITPKGEVIGARASLSRDREVYTNEKLVVDKGSAIFRNLNHSFEKELEKNMPQRFFEVDVVFKYENGITSLSAKSEDGREVTVKIEGRFDKATDLESAVKSIKTQIGKSWEGYLLKVTEVHCQTVLFYPVSVLNRARREIVAGLEKMDVIRRADTGNRKQELHGNIQGETLLRGIKLDYRSNVANKYAKELYYRIGAGSVEDAYELNPVAGAELMRCKYCIKFETGMCPVEGSTVKLYEPLFLENGGRKFRLEFDCEKCEMVIFG